MYKYTKNRENVYVHNNKQGSEPNIPWHSTTKVEVHVTRKTCMYDIIVQHLKFYFFVSNTQKQFFFKVYCMLFTKNLR